MATKTAKKETRHRKPKQSYASYVQKTLHGDKDGKKHTAIPGGLGLKDVGMSGKALAVMSSIAQDTVNQIAHKSQALLNSTKKQTLTSDEVKFAAQQLGAGEMGKHMVSELTKAVTKYDASKKGRLSERAGVLFPAARITSMLRKQRFGKRVSPSAGVATAAVAQYVVEETLDLANEARGKAKRITSRHIFLGIQEDAELQKVLRGTISGGGAVPFIAPQLESKKRKATENVAASSKKAKTASKSKK